MGPTTQGTAGLSAPAAAAIASAALVVPLALSASSAPSPNHPRTFLWYRSLRQPRFKPPDSVFPVAWTGIDAALAFAGYRLLQTPPSAARSRAIALWVWNLLSIGGWSRLFFKQHRLGVSTVAAAGLLASSVAFVKEADPVDRAASRSGLPLIGWVAFATVLTATIWHLNAPKRG